MREAPLRRAARSVVVVAMAACVALGLDAASAQEVVTYRDDFGAIGYSGNNGSAAWNGPWRELGESNGPGAGVVQVVGSDRCASGNCLRIGGTAATLNGRGAERRATTGPVTSATLSFRYRRQSVGGAAGTVNVHVSGNGGSSWAVVTSIAMAGSQNLLTRTIDVTSAVGERTVVRFIGSGGTTDGELFIDEVTLSVVPDTTPTTTTTTAPPTTIPSTTTTTSPSTTSTTSPTPASTTTTSAPATTTTTSTTTPAETTTTTPGGATTTTTETPQSTTTTAAASSEPGDPAPIVEPSDTSGNGSHGQVVDDQGNVADPEPADAGQGAAPDALQPSTTASPQAPSVVATVFGAVADNAIAAVALAALVAGMWVIGFGRDS